MSLSPADPRRLREGVFLLLFWEEWSWVCAVAPIISSNEKVGRRFFFWGLGAGVSSDSEVVELLTRLTERTPEDIADEVHANHDRPFTERPRWMQVLDAAREKADQTNDEYGKSRYRFCGSNIANRYGQSSKSSKRSFIQKSISHCPASTART